MAPNFCKYFILIFIINTDLCLCKCPKIVSKQEWGGRKAVQVEYAITPVENVIVHHTATPECQTKSECMAYIVEIQNYHMDSANFDDIGYNFLIGGDGNIFEGAGWHLVGAHAAGYNRKSLGIAFIEKTPPPQQMRSANNLLECAMELNELDKDYKLFGASQVMATASPGVELFKEIRKWKHFSEDIPPKTIII